MRFRPCIDIHNGKVKQIVGGSLRDEMDQAVDNFVSGLDAAWYARLYMERGLSGGHIILLNPKTSPWYEADLAQAKGALEAYPGGLMIGGGVDAENAPAFIDMGASHVIVTSYVFRDGRVDMDRLEKMRQAVGKEHLVLDLSCRRRGGDYMIVTDRWQKFTDMPLNIETMDLLMDYCSEYLIHAVDVEGHASGIEEDLARMLGAWHRLPITYAGGVGSMADVQLLKDLGGGRLDVTIGSALDLFGGSIPFETAAAIGSCCP